MPPWYFYFYYTETKTNPGIITTGIGLLCLIIIPTDPLHTRILSPAERALALARIDADQLVKTGGRRGRTNMRAVLRAFNFNVSRCHSGFPKCDTAGNISHTDYAVYRLLYIRQHIVPRAESLHAYCGFYSFVSSGFLRYLQPHWDFSVGKFSTSLGPID